MEQKKKYPVVLSIAGSDSGGGAGIQADLKTFSALGAFGTTAITAVTAQNTVKVFDIHSVPALFLQKQIEAVFDDFNPNAVKIGMLHTSEIVATVTQCLQKYNPQYIVLDPVMVATSGDTLIITETIEAIKTQLIPMATLITPNIDEAEILLQSKIGSLDEMKKAAVKLLSLGCNAVLLKGGHLKGEKMYDVFCDITGINILASNYIQTNNTHGTGCTLSSAVAAHLARGYSLLQSVELSKQYISNAIEAGKDVCIGNGHGPVNHFFNPLKLKPL